MAITLEDLGYFPGLETYRKEQKLDSFGIGRVVSEHKERYVVKTPESEFDAEIVGNLRFTAKNRSDFPAVGDWVAISEYDEQKVLIHAILPRKTIIERQAVGKAGEKQVIATNIDSAFIVQAVDRDFNLNRIERYLTICHSSRVKPIIILNKTDLISELQLQELIRNVQERMAQIPLLALSNQDQSGLLALKQLILPGQTYCLLGSSGVGKSTLLNLLSGEPIMKTSAVSESTNRGRHVTTHRELRLLEKGGLIVDNPGMREVGIADSGSGIEMTFDAIAERSRQCRFLDCTHTTERGCAVLEALDQGALDPDSYENYQRLEREKAHFESTVAEKRKKDKAFGKMVKNVKKIKGQSKY